MVNINLNLSLPVDVVCVQCKQKMVQSKPNDNFVTCPGCGFKASLDFSRMQPQIRDLRSVTPASKFRRPGPVA